MAPPFVRTNSDVFPGTTNTQLPYVIPNGVDPNDAVTHNKRRHKNPLLQSSSDGSSHFVCILSESSLPNPLPADPRLRITTMDAILGSIASVKEPRALIQRVRFIEEFMDSPPKNTPPLFIAKLWLAKSIVTARLAGLSGENESALLNRSRDQVRTAIGLTKDLREANGGSDISRLLFLAHQLSIEIDARLMQYASAGGDKEALNLFRNEIGSGVRILTERATAREDIETAAELHYRVVFIFADLELWKDAIDHARKLTSGKLSGTKWAQDILSDETIGLFGDGTRIYTQYEVDAYMRHGVWRRAQMALRHARSKSLKEIAAVTTAGAAVGMAMSTILTGSATAMFGSAGAGIASTAYRFINALFSEKASQSQYSPVIVEKMSAAVAAATRLVMGGAATMAAVSVPSAIASNPGEVLELGVNIVGNYKDMLVGIPERIASGFRQLINSDLSTVINGIGNEIGRLSIRTLEALLSNLAAGLSPSKGKRMKDYLKMLKPSLKNKAYRKLPATLIGDMVLNSMGKGLGNGASNAVFSSLVGGMFIYWAQLPVILTLNGWLRGDINTSLRSEEAKEDHKDSHPVVRKWHQVKAVVSEHLFTPYAVNRILRPLTDITGNAGRLALGWGSSTGQALSSANRLAYGNVLATSISPENSGTPREQAQIQEILTGGEYLHLTDFLYKAGMRIPLAYPLLDWSSLKDSALFLAADARVIKPELFPQMPNPATYANMWLMIMGRAKNNLDEAQVVALLDNVREMSKQPKHVDILVPVVKTLLMAGGSEKHGKRMKDFFKEYPEILVVADVVASDYPPVSAKDRYAGRAVVQRKVQMSFDDYERRAKVRQRIDGLKRSDTPLFGGVDLITIPTAAVSAGEQYLKTGE